MHIFLFSKPIYIPHLGKFSFQFEGVMLVIRVQLLFFFCGMIYFSSHSIHDCAYLVKQKKMCASIPVAFLNVPKKFFFMHK